MRAHKFAKPTLTFSFPSQKRISAEKDFPSQKRRVRVFQSRCQGGTKELCTTVTRRNSRNPDPMRRPQPQAATRSSVNSRNSSEALRLIKMFSLTAKVSSIIPNLFLSTSKTSSLSTPSSHPSSGLLPPIICLWYASARLHIKFTRVVGPCCVPLWDLIGCFCLCVVWDGGSGGVAESEVEGARRERGNEGAGDERSADFVEFQGGSCFNAIAWG